MLYSQDAKVGNFAILPLASVSTTNVSKHVAEQDGSLLWGWDISRDAPYCIFFIIFIFPIDLLWGVGYFA
jgi:hypothetical protein